MGQCWQQPCSALGNGGLLAPQDKAVRGGGPTLAVRGGGPTLAVRGDGPTLQGNLLVQDTLNSGHQGGAERGGAVRGEGQWERRDSGRGGAVREVGQWERRDSERGWAVGEEGQ